MRNKLFLFLFIIILINFVLADDLTIKLSKPTATTYNIIFNSTFNSSDFWDNLNTPADITYDEISGGNVNAGGYTGYFAFLVGTVGGIDMNGDPWYWSGVGQEFSGDVYVDNNLEVYGNSTLEGNLNVTGYINGTNMLLTGNLTSSYLCNSTNCYTIIDFLNTNSFNQTYNNYVTNNISNLTYNFALSNNGTINGINITWLDNVVGFLSFKLTQLETWFTGKLIDINNNINLNSTSDRIYTNDRIAGNLTLTLLKNGSTIGTGNFNFGNFNISGIDNLTSNKICNSTNCYNLNQFLIDTTGGTDSWALNYTFYYNSTQINLIVSSNDTWRTNYTLYPTKSDLYANLTGYLLINGSRALTGNLNFGGYNISNIDNLTSNKLCNTTNCYTLAQLLATSSSTDTWSLNYSFYSNSTVTNNAINLNYTSSLTTCNANINNNRTSINSNINNNYTSSLTTCNANINNNLTQINLNLYSNLSNYLLANGSRAGTGNFNFGGKNISNVDNISVSTVNFGTNRIYSNTTCVVITGISSKLEIC